MDHEHLARTSRSRSDSDSGDGLGFGGSRCEFRRDTLQDGSEASSLLQTVRVLKEAHCIVHLLTLHLEPAHHIEALWGQAQMAHYGTLTIDQSASHVDTLGTSLELHGVGTTLKEAPRIAYRLLAAEVKAQIRHIAHQQGALSSAWNRLDVVIHHGHGDRQGAVEAEADIAHTVANEDDVDDRIG